MKTLIAALAAAALITATATVHAEAPEIPGKPSLHLSQTFALTGETIIATATFPNATDRTLALALSIHAPQGWSLTAASTGTACNASACSSARATPPRSALTVAAALTPATAGRSPVQAQASWRDPESGAHASVSVSQQVNVLAAHPPEPAPPGRAATPPVSGGCAVADATPGAALPLTLAAALALPAIPLARRRGAPGTSRNNRDKHPEDTPFAGKQ